MDGLNAKKEKGRGKLCSIACYVLSDWFEEYKIVVIRNNFFFHFCMRIRKLKRVPRWFPSPLLVIVLCVLVIWVFHLQSAITVVGTVPQGFPPISKPPITLHNFIELFPGAAVVTLLSFMVYSIMCCVMLYG